MNWLVFLGLCLAQKLNLTIERNSCLTPLAPLRTAVQDQESEANRGGRDMKGGVPLFIKASPSPDGVQTPMG